jgi:hypothetical protein
MTDANDVEQTTRQIVCNAMDKKPEQATIEPQPAGA